MQGRFDRQERLYQAIRLMRRIDLNAGRVMQRALAGTGLTPARRVVLEALVEHGAMTVPETAARLSLKRQFVQRIMTELIAEELVATEANPAHKRSFLCRVTPEGGAAFEAIHQRELALMSSHLGDINMTEVIVAFRVVGRVADCFAALAGGEEPDEPKAEG
jgi:DNA-binding MarR family transcriptional regulator